MTPPPLQAAPRPSERVQLARLALATALATPGVAAGCPGPGGRRVTADAPAPLTGISAIAEPDGRYELALCLDAEPSRRSPRSRSASAIASTPRPARPGWRRCSARSTSSTPTSWHAVIALARALARLVGFLLLVALAVAGLAAAVFCISTGTSGPSLGGLARLVHAAALRDSLGGWFDQLAASGSAAVVAALAGLGAMLLGLVLVIGVLVPRRERLVVLTEQDEGTLAARRRPLAQVAEALAEQGRGVTEAKVRVRPRRRTRGGRLRVRATRPRPADPGEVRVAVEHELGELTGPFALSTRIQITDDGAKVQ